MLTRTDGFLSRELHQAMLSSSYDKAGLNLKLKLHFVSAHENILGLSAVTHYNRIITTYHHFDAPSEWSEAHHLERLVFGVVNGSTPGMTILFLLANNWTMIY